MAQDPDELVVASNADIHVAPSGTALPAENDVDAALHADYENLGLVSEDGITFGANPEIQEFFAMQRAQAVRRERVRQELSFGFTLQQWNVETVPFAFGGGTVVETASGVFRYTFPDDNDSLDERAIVIDWQDGAKKYRLAFHRSNVTEGVETNLTRSNLAMLPVSAKVLSADDTGSPGFLLIEDVAFSSVS